MTPRDLDLIMQVAFAWWAAVTLIYLILDLFARRRIHRHYANRFTRRGEFSR